jgi:hypothetical protein
MKRLGIGCLTCRYSKCIHCSNLRASCKKDDIPELISYLPLSTRKAKEAHVQAEDRLDASRLACQIPIACRPFPLPGAHGFSEPMNQAILMREATGLMSSVGLNPAPRIPPLDKCECPLVPRVGNAACFCGRGFCKCEKPKAWEKCDQVSEGCQVENTYLFNYYFQTLIKMSKSFFPLFYL